MFGRILYLGLLSRNLVKDLNLCPSRLLPMALLSFDACVWLWNQKVAGLIKELRNSLTVYFECVWGFVLIFFRKFIWISQLHYLVLDVFSWGTFLLLIQPLSRYFFRLLISFLFSLGKLYASLSANNPSHLNDAKS